MQVMQINTQATRRSGGLDYKWILAMVVILGVFMSILDQTIVNIAIPRLQTAFGADIHEVQWVLTAYIVAQGVAVPTAAYFADTLGIKRFYIISSPSAFCKDVEGQLCFRFQLHFFSENSLHRNGVLLWDFSAFPRY